MHRHFLEAQPRRQRDAFAERQHFAGAERRTNDNSFRGVRHRRAQQRLVAIVGKTHRKQGVALEMMVASSSAGRCVTRPR